MGLIKEPLNVDFYVDSRALTKKERETISQHIIDYKEKMAKRKSRRLTAKKKFLFLKNDPKKNLN